MRSLSRRRGFTLLELLIAVSIIGLVMATVVPLFFSVLSSYHFHQDIAWAKQRGQIAVAAVEPMALAAGIGLPNNDEDFQNAFAGCTPLLPAVEQERFKRAVQLAEDGKRVDPAPGAGSAEEGSELWLVYSLPTGCGTNVQYDLKAGDTVELKKSEGQVEHLERLDVLPNQKGELKGWLTFPGSPSPFSVEDGTDLSGGVLALGSALDAKIRAFDEVHAVRAAKIQAVGGELMIDHLDPSGEQPVVEGIYAMKCTYDPEGDRVLTMWVLARGNIRHDREITGAVEGWQGSLAGLDRHYRYTVVSKSWRIRN